MKSCSMITMPANWRGLKAFMFAVVWAFSKLSIYAVS
jgi:hypothetical protein